MFDRIYCTSVFPSSPLTATKTVLPRVEEEEEGTSRGMGNVWLETKTPSPPSSSLSYTRTLKKSQLILCLSIFGFVTSVLPAPLSPSPLSFPRPRRGHPGRLFLLLLPLLLPRGGSCTPGRWIRTTRTMATSRSILPVLGGLEKEEQLLWTKRGTWPCSAATDQYARPRVTIFQGYKQYNEDK